MDVEGKHIDESACLKGEEKDEDKALSEMRLEKNATRGQWTNKLDSILSLIGYCVGYGNIWRFPYFCMRNGGGAFLVAFLCILVVCGLPAYFIDMAIGQFSGKTSLHAWEMCPLLKGIGSGAIVVLFIITSYYNIIIAWTLFYLVNSFFSPLPWKSCKNSWNTRKCVVDRFSFNASINIMGNFTYSVYSNSTDRGPSLAETGGKLTSEEEFWQNRLLELSSGIEELGGIPWHMAVSLLVAWILIFFCLIRGIRSSGKVVYVTAILPYILLTVLLIRGSLLPGAGDGIRFYLTPDFKKLTELQVWLEAALQVFYSLCPGWGPIITLASYNKFNNNCFRDSIMLTFICEGTSVYGGFVVFAVLGHMAHETGIHISKVVTSGPGLVFMTYPEALSQLPLPNLWSVLFFLMLLTVGLDCQFSTSETIVTATLDHFPSLRSKRIVVHGLACLMWYLIGLILCCKGGMYVFVLLDWYVALTIPLLACISCVIVGWIYGAERFSRDVTLMLGRGIPVVMRIAICIVGPLILMAITVFSLATYKAPSYGNYQFPSHVNAIGMIIGLIPAIPVVVVAFYAVKNAPGCTVIQRIVNASKPSHKWRPASRQHAKCYKYDTFKEYTTFWSLFKLNLLGQANSSSNTGRHAQE